MGSNMLGTGLLPLSNVVNSGVTNSTGTSDSTTTSVANQAWLQALAEQMALAMIENLPVPGADGSSDMASSDMTTSGSNPMNNLLQSSELGLNSGTSTMSTADWLQMASLGLPMLSGLTPSPDSTSGLTNLNSVSDTNSSNPNWVTTTPAAVADAIQQASAKYGVPASLIHSVIMQESGMNPTVISSAGAVGLMQLMPETAASLGVNPYDPVQNIDGGTKYLANLLQTYQGNTSLALAAYNAGPGAVDKYGGIPPYAETQSYVKDVLAGAGLSS